MKKIYLLFCILGFIAFIQSMAYTQTVGDCRSKASGNWSNTTIWQVYNGTKWVDTISIPISSNGTITISQGTTVTLDFPISVDQLVVVGILTLSGGNLTIINAGSYGATFSGTINGTKNILFDFGSTSDFANGTIQGTGILDIHIGAIVNFSGSFTNDRKITNNGTINWLSGNVNGTGVINNNSLMYFSCTNNNSIYDTIYNIGSVIKNASANNAVYGGFYNTGTLNVQTGTLNIWPLGIGTYSESGTISISNGATLSFGSNNASVFNVTSNISGAGTFTLQAGTANFNSGCTYNISGATYVSYGNVNFNSVMTLINLGNLNINGGIANFLPGLIIPSIGSTLNVANGTANFNTGNYYTFSTINIGGIITGNDSIIATGTVTHTNGSFSGTGGLTFSATARYNTAPINSSVNIDRNVYNYGVLNWTQGSITGTGTLYNYDSILISGSSTRSNFLILYNYAAITKSGSGTFNSYIPITNTGTVIITGGAFILYPAAGTYIHSGSFSVAAGCTLQIGSGSNATHNFSGQITSSGTVNMATATVNLTSGCIFNNSGNTNADAGTINFDSAMTLTNIGTLKLNGGTVNFPSGLNIQAIGTTLNVNGGTVNFNTGTFQTFSTVNVGGILAGSDSIIVTGTITQTNGNITGTGALTLPAGARFNTNPVNSSINIDKKLYNYGLINWTNGGLSGTGTIYNYDTILNTVPAFCYSNVGIINNGILIKNNAANLYTYGSIANSGSFILTGGMISLSEASGTYSHTGLFSVSSGCTLQFAGSATHNVTGQIISSGIISIQTTTVTLTSSCVFNNSGNTVINAGVSNFNSGMNLINLGSLSVNGGTANFPAGLNIQAMSSTMNITSGTANFSTGVPHTIAVLNLGGILTGSDSIIATGTVTQTNGAFQGTGGFTLMSGAVFNTSPINSGITIDKKFYNYGQINWSLGNISGTGKLYNYDTINITVTGSRTFSLAVINSGLILKNSTGSTSLIAPLTNTGNVNILSGTLIPFSGTNLNTINIFANAILTIQTTFTNSGKLILQEYTSVVNGSGTLTLNADTVTNNGTISVSTIQVNGNTFLNGTGAVTSASFTALNGGNLKLASSHQFKNVFINPGGTIDLNGKILQVNGTGTIITNNGNFNTANSTVEYNGTSAQIVSVTNILYSSLSVNNSAGVTISAARTIPDTLFLVSGTFTVGGFLTMGDNSVIQRGNGNLSASPVFTTKVNVLYNGTNPITTGFELPSVASVLGYLKVNNAAGVTLGNDATVNDSLIFTDGILNTTGSYKIYLGTTANVIGETSTSYLTGVLVSSLNVGTSSSNFNNIGVMLNGGTDDLGLVTVTRTSGSDGIITANGKSGISRNWLISASNQPVSGRNLILSWVSADDNGLGFSSSNRAKVWSNSNGNWLIAGSPKDVSQENPRTITVNSITHFSAWTVTDSINVFVPTFNLTALVEGLFNGSTTVQDTFNVYLAGSSAPYNIADSAKVVSDIYGNMVLNFPNAANGMPYYLIIKHRNSIETWSSNTIIFSGYNSVYDFTLAQNKAYGSNLILKNGKFCIYSGDVSNISGQYGVQDGFIDGNDNVLISTDAENFTSGWVISDLNGDGFVDGNDDVLCFNNAGNFVGVVRPTDAPGISKNNQINNTKRKKNIFRR